MVILQRISIVGYRIDIIIDILVVDRLSSIPSAGRKRMRRQSAAPSCYDLIRWLVISMKNLKE